MRVHLADMLRLGLRGSLLCLTALIAACQSVSDQSAGPDLNEAAQAARVDAREARLGEIDTFSLNGALGIWTDQESISAKINWQQQQDTLNLKITGPLGLGDLTLQDNGRLVTLERGNQLLASGESGDLVLQDALALNAPVPLEQIRLWVKGLPGNANSVVRDTQGKLSSLRFKDKQGIGWQARFLRYTPIDEVFLPSLITASGGPYSLRLRLKNWQLVPTSVVPEKPESNKRLAIPSR
ncbi:MAG: lipoprotein insertase outer membrane protein LolB [Granulosicoccus sp.]